MGIEKKCGIEHCFEQPISCLCVHDGCELKDYKFSCLAHEKMILGQLKEKYQDKDKYSLTIADVTQIQE